LIGTIPETLICVLNPCVLALSLGYVLVCITGAQVVSAEPAFSSKVVRFKGDV
jgi:hypothetical protein